MSAWAADAFITLRRPLSVDRSIVKTGEIQRTALTIPAFGPYRLDQAPSDRCIKRAWFGFLVGEANKVSLLPNQNNTLCRKILGLSHHYVADGRAVFGVRQRE
ncbi:hypothetical protein [Sphingomonas sp. 37zxx]|uniref:hypothetical protein n=1 Tax=Sphingomonas sp. 37zxx TaxID=1550073 RepID=UPI00053BE07F|nr:hypothetical protein [Sphingomonas sp. 37zxx]